MTSRAIKFHYAVDASQLEITYQPIFGAHHARLIGARALPRWTQDGLSIAPGALCHIESTAAVLRQIAEDYSGYLWACKNFTIHLELSAQAILDTHFPDLVDAVLARYDIPPPALTFGLGTGVRRDQPTGASRFTAQPLSITALARRYFSIANEAQTLPR